MPKCTFDAVTRSLYHLYAIPLPPSRQGSLEYTCSDQLQSFARGLTRKLSKCEGLRWNARWDTFFYCRPRQRSACASDLQWEEQYVSEGRKEAKEVRTRVSRNVFIGFSRDLYLHIHGHILRSQYGVRAKSHMALDEYEGDMEAIDDHIPIISGLRWHNMVQNISFRAQVRFIFIFIVTKSIFYDHSLFSLHIRRFSNKE